MGLDTSSLVCSNRLRDLQGMQDEISKLNHIVQFRDVLFLLLWTIQFLLSKTKNKPNKLFKIFSQLSHFTMIQQIFRVNRKEKPEIIWWSVLQQILARKYEHPFLAKVKMRVKWQFHDVWAESLVLNHSNLLIAQSAGAVEYTDCFSAEE